MSEGGPPRLPRPTRLSALGLVLLFHAGLVILLIRQVETVSHPAVAALVMVAVAPAAKPAIPPAPRLAPPRLAPPPSAVPTPPVLPAIAPPRYEIAQEEPPTPVETVAEALPAVPARSAAATADPIPAANNPAPVYPERARKQGMEGTVLIKVAVDIEGAPTAVTVSTSSGHDMLDEEALRTVRRWRFRPALLDGRVVAGLVIVPIIFELHA